MSDTHVQEISHRIVDLASQVSDSNINNRHLLTTNYSEFLAMADSWWCDTNYSNYVQDTILTRYRDSISAIMY